MIRCMGTTKTTTINWREKYTLFFTDKTCLWSSPVSLTCPCSLCTLPHPRDMRSCHERVMLWGAWVWRGRCLCWTFMPCYHRSPWRQQIKPWVSTSETPVFNNMLSAVGIRNIQVLNDYLFVLDRRSGRVCHSSALRLLFWRCLDVSGISWSLSTWTVTQSRDHYFSLFYFLLLLEEYRVAIVII